MITTEEKKQIKETIEKLNFKIDYQAKLKRSLELMLRIDEMIERIELLNQKNKTRYEG